MRSLLFDEKGEEWPAHSRELQRALGTNRTGEALAEFVVRNMGFAEIAHVGRAAEICFCEATVSPHALIGLLQWVHDNPEPRVLLKLLGKPAPLIIRRRDQVNAAIGRLIQERVGSPLAFPSRFQKTRIRIGRSRFADRMVAVRAILSMSISRRIQLQMLEHLLDGFVTLSEFDPEIGTYRIRHMAERYGMFDASFCSQAEGKTFADTHDIAYGRWVAEAHDSIHDCTEPVAEVIHAQIEWPRRPRREFIYSRLMVPLKLASGRHLIVGATAL